MSPAGAEQLDGIVCIPREARALAYPLHLVRSIMADRFIDITDSLDLASGGEAPQGKEPGPLPMNLRGYAGCLNWAKSSDDNRDVKIAACTQEFVRRNWDNFTPR